MDAVEGKVDVVKGKVDVVEGQVNVVAVMVDAVGAKVNANVFPTIATLFYYLLVLYFFWFFFVSQRNCLLSCSYLKMQQLLVQIIVLTHFTLIQEIVYPDFCDAS